MKEPQSRKIDGFNIIVQPWPARKAWKNQITFGRVFGPSLRELGEALETKEPGKSLMESNVGYGKIGEAISNLFQNISEDESESILMKCIVGIRVNEVEITSSTFETFDLLFQGELITIYKIIGFVMEVNYGSFLGKSGIGKLLKKV